MKARLSRTPRTTCGKRQRIFVNTDEPWPAANLRRMTPAKFDTD
jgi:hypothetical protein